MINLFDIVENIFFYKWFFFLSINFFCVHSIFLIVSIHNSPLLSCLYDIQALVFHTFPIPLLQHYSESPTHRKNNFVLIRNFSFVYNVWINVSLSNFSWRNALIVLFETWSNTTTSYMWSLHSMHIIIIYQKYCLNV